MISQEKTVALQTELCAWRFNRQLYPGWLIAPYQTRDRVWLHTRYWLDYAIESAKNWPSAQVIILWRELAWRLETCLQLVPDQALEGLRCALDGVGEYEDAGCLKFDVRSLQEESWPRELRLKSQQLREDWIECMLVLLQAYRLRPDLTTFQDIAEQLHSLDYLSTNQKCQLLYQSCLVALAELDRDRATSLVEMWPEKPEDPYWLVRKAGIYLELGDELTATAVAVEALERIRKRRLADQYSYWGLSREGWCQRFLWQISRSRHTKSLRDESVPEPDVDVRQRNFDRELEESRSSPDAELRLIQERISGRVIPLNPVARTKDSPDFDSGIAGETIHLGAYEPADRLSAAINILRLSELSGLPPSVGYVNFFRKTIAEALLWVREEYPGLWSACVFRYRGIGLDKYREPGSNRNQETIRRDILGILPVSHIKRLHDVSIRELYRVFEIADSRGTNGRDTDRHDAVMSIRRLGSAATKFSMCLGDKEREEVFVIFLRLSRTETLSQNLLLRNTLWDMARRTVPYFSVEMINKWATEIFIQFPLVSEESHLQTGWPEITEFIPKYTGEKLTRPNLAEFGRGVARLLELLSSSNLIERTGAAWRLLGMYDRGLLSESECGAYREVLWGRLDENGLPHIDSEILRITVHLRWPSESEEAVLQGISSWIRSQNIEDRFTPRQDEGDSGLRQFSVSFPDRENFLSEIRALYFQLSRKPDLLDRVFSPSIQTEVLAKVLAWWQRERERFMSEHQTYRIFGGNVFERVEATLQVLFECAIANGIRNEEFESELKSFLKDIKQVNQTGVFWYQISAYLGTLPEEENWRRVRTDLWGNDSRVAYSAMLAWFHWILKRKSLKLGPVPKDVLFAVMSDIGSVRGERCLQACQLVTQLVELGYIHGDDMDEVLLNSAVNSAITQLFKDAIPETASLGIGAQRELLSHLRRELTLLLVTMNRQGITLEQTGIDWLRRAKIDRFVDVRFLVEEDEM